MTCGTFLTDCSVNPQWQNRHEAVGQSLDLVAGEEVDGKVALWAFVVPDRQAGSCAPRQHCVGVLDLGTDGVHSDAEEPTRHHEINRCSNMSLSLRLRPVLENLNSDNRPES